MFELVCFLLIIAALVELLKWLCTLVEMFFAGIAYYFIIFGHFLEKNYWMILGISCLVASVLYLIYNKPHRWERIYKQYKKGLITRNQALMRIGDTMYDPYSPLPSATSSRVNEKRINALSKRLRAETEFVQDLKEYIIKKES